MSQLTVEGTDILIDDVIGIKYDETNILIDKNRECSIYFIHIFTVNFGHKMFFMKTKEEIDTKFQVLLDRFIDFYEKEGSNVYVQKINNTYIRILPKLDPEYSNIVAFDD